MPVPELPHGPEDASPWVLRFAPLIPADGTILDVACGTGRHVRMFLNAGNKVVGVDKHVAGIANLMGTDGFEFIEVDLENGSRWPLVGRRFDAVIVTNYLHRPLFPALAGTLNPGGVLIYETFAVGNERYGRPNNPDFLLRPGELLDAFSGALETVAYMHGPIGSPPRAVVQRICARNRGRLSTD